MDFLVCRHGLGRDRDTAGFFVATLMESADTEPLIEFDRELRVAVAFPSPEFFEEEGASSGDYSIDVLSRMD